jgi:hypothetical protein
MIHNLIMMKTILHDQPIVMKKKKQSFLILNTRI